MNKNMFILKKLKVNVDDGTITKKDIVIYNNIILYEWKRIKDEEKELWKYERILPGGKKCIFF